MCRVIHVSERNLLEAILADSRLYQRDAHSLAIVAGLSSSFTSFAAMNLNSFSASSSANAARVPALFCNPCPANLPVTLSGHLDQGEERAGGGHFVHAGG